MDYDKFRERWLKLPPLVRASAACNAANMLAQTCHRVMHTDVHNEKLLGMHRRAQVSTQFNTAYMRLAELLADLANESDDELPVEYVALTAPAPLTPPVEPTPSPTPTEEP